MKQKPFSCSIGIWNCHLAPSKSESRIFLWPYASPLCRPFLGVFWPFLAHLRHFEHKNSEISKKNFKTSKLAFFDYFWLHVAAMGSGVSGIDTSNIWRVLGLYSQKFGDSGGSGETFFSENQSQWRILETWKKNGQGQELLLVSLLHPLGEIRFSCQIIITKRVY